MTVRFNVPPGWPTPPLSWAPTEDWLPDPEWPEPPEGWSFWSPVLEAAGSLSVADRAALEAELDRADPASYGCTVVTWWTAAGEVTPASMAGQTSAVGVRPAPISMPGRREAEPVPVGQLRTAVPEAQPLSRAEAPRPLAGPRRRTATVPRRGALIAAVILCALGLVGFQASRVLFVSDDGGDSQEIPKPLPVSGTRLPTTDPSSRTAGVTAPAVRSTTASTDRPELVAARVASPSTTAGPTTGRTSTPARATTAVPSGTPGRTTAPVATKRPTATTRPGSTSTGSAKPTVPRPTTPTRPQTVAPKPVVPPTATAVPAGGGRS